MQQSQDYLGRYEQWLWQVTKYFLKDFANFHEEKEFSFILHTNPFPEQSIPAGPYRLGKNVDDSHIYRTHHPLAQRIIENIKSEELKDVEIVFDYSNSGKKITILEPLIGKSGYLTGNLFTISALEDEDNIILSAVTDNGEILDYDQSSRLFSLDGEKNNGIELPDQINSILSQSFEAQKSVIIHSIGERNSGIFNQEIEKLDKWADDNRVALKTKMNELDNKIKEKKKEARLSSNLPEKLQMRKEIQALEKKYDAMWKEYEDQAKDIERRKDGLIDDLEGRLSQNTEVKKLFAIRWKII
jgi:hypothetical protein